MPTFDRYNNIPLGNLTDDDLLIIQDNSSLGVTYNVTLGQLKAQLGVEETIAEAVAAHVIVQSDIDSNRFNNVDQEDLGSFGLLFTFEYTDLTTGNMVTAETFVFLPQPENGHGIEDITTETVDPDATHTNGGVRLTIIHEDPTVADTVLVIYNGDDGAQGDPGEKGDQGEPGAPGATGQRGATGDPGPDGPRGLQGEAGPRGPQGFEGVYNLDIYKAVADTVTGSALTTALEQPGDVSYNYVTDTFVNNPTDQTEVSLTNDWTTSTSHTSTEILYVRRFRIVPSAISSPDPSVVTTLITTNDWSDPFSAGSQGIQGEMGNPGEKGDKGEQGDGVTLTNVASGGVPGETSRLTFTNQEIDPVTGAITSTTEEVVIQPGIIGATGATGDPGATGVQGGEGAKGDSVTRVEETIDPITGNTQATFFTPDEEVGSVLINRGEPGANGSQGRYNISVFQSFAVGDTIPATVTFNIGEDGVITSDLGDWSLTPTVVDNEDLYEGRYNFDPAGGAVVSASFAVFRAGEAGPAGMDGDSAFEIFVTETGNPDGLTEAQWIASLEGTSVTVTDTADGAVVSDGTTAVTITDGQDGSPGDNGDQGFYTVFININSATAPTVFGGDGIITPPTNGDGGLSWSFAQNFADDGVDPVYQSAAVFNPALPDAVLTWATPYLATGSAGPAGPSGTPGTIRVGGQDYTTLSLANSDDIVFVDNSGVISAELADGAGGAGSVDSYVDADGNVILLLDDTTIEFYETEIPDNSPTSRLTLGDNVGDNVDPGDIIQFPGINGLFGGRPISTRGFLVTAVTNAGAFVDIDENITFTFPAGTQFKLFKTGTGTRRTVVTDNNQLTNGAGYITDNGVDANPPLVGTEQTLNSVTIDNTTYKIVGGGGTSPTTADREAFFGVSPTDPGGLVLDALLTEAPGNAHNGQVLGPFTYTGVGPDFPDQFAIINLPSSLVDGHTVTFNWGSTASGPFFVQAEDVDSYGDLLDVHETYIMGFADTIYIQVHINPIT